MTIFVIGFVSLQKTAQITKYDTLVIVIVIISHNVRAIDTTVVTVHLGILPIRCVKICLSLSKWPLAWI